METTPVKEEFRKLALDLGFDACRFTTAAPPETSARFQAWIEAGRHGEMAYLQRNAPKRMDPQLVLAGARTIISLAASYAVDQPAPDASTNAIGIIARYARRTDYHDVLAEKLKLLAQRIDERGGCRSLWYTDTGPLLERDLAQRAGIGFIGKHTNLVSRSLGNWFLLSEIITTRLFEPDAPEHNRCGSCSRCVTACPTGAITAPFEVDARRCISYLTIELKGPIPEEFRPGMGSRIFGCDDCLAACPWNRFAREGRLMRNHAKPDLIAPDLIELLALDDSAFKRRFQGTPIMRTKRRSLLRNVCVALGNLRDPSSLPALRQASNDPEPLISEHARWAIQQIETRRATPPGTPLSTEGMVSAMERRAIP